AADALREDAPRAARARLLRPDPEQREVPDYPRDLGIRPPTWREHPGDRVVAGAFRQYQKRLLVKPRGAPAIRRAERAARRWERPSPHPSQRCLLEELQECLRVFAREL